MDKSRMTHTILMRGLLFAATLSTVGLAAAQTPPPADEELEPEVTIRPNGQGFVEEYRIKGQLYMVKVTPKRGFPYYLIDTDGDGNLETRRSNFDPDVLIPRWTLFRWK